MHAIRFSFFVIYLLLRVERMTNWRTLTVDDHLDREFHWLHEDNIHLPMLIIDHNDHNENNPDDIDDVMYFE